MTDEWTVEKILIPSDGSEQAELAINPAIDIAKSKGAELIALYVIPDLMYYGVIPTIDRSETEKEYEEKHAREVLRKIRIAAEEKGVKVKKVVRRGRPADEILTEAEKEGVDLIVMGTKGRSGTKRIIGSVADAVIREAHCPVLAIRELRKTT
jgi:nucleotide-binding universal stress UspA family protein